MSSLGAGGVESSSTISSEGVRSFPVGGKEYSVKMDPIGSWIIFRVSPGYCPCGVSLEVGTDAGMEWCSECRGMAACKVDSECHRSVEKKRLKEAKEEAERRRVKERPRERWRRGSRGRPGRLPWYRSSGVSLKVEAGVGMEWSARKLQRKVGVN